MVRNKFPEANLRLSYGKVLWICIGVSAFFNVCFITLFPKLGGEVLRRSLPPIIIELEQIPETRQKRKPPPPPRPAVPVATNDINVPDAVTIETTDFDLDLEGLEPPPPLQDLVEEEVELEEEEEELVELWQLEQQPIPTKRVQPEYPEIARKAGLVGTVFVVVQLGRDGKVEMVIEATGEPRVFHQVAKVAAADWEFTPAIQNDNPVRVRVMIPFKFKLE